MMNAPKGQALRTIWNIRRTIPNGKGSTSDAKNRRKGMLRCTCMQSNQIMQHHTRWKIQKKI